MNYQKKVITGGFIGNLVEAYDLSICYFLSAELSKALLGDSKGKPTVIFSLIFIAYLAKPLGSLILGILSDRYGRKNVLVSSLIIMGSATALMGLIPNYHSIGLWAAGFFLLLRIIQSMALGSEFLNSSSLLVESGSEKQRGFRGCWSSVGVKAGYLMACLLVESIHYYSPESPSLWRLPFFLALAFTSLGYVIRIKMPESLAYIRYYSERSKPSTMQIYKQALHFTKTHPFLIHFAFFTSFLSVATGYFFYLYIPIHAMEYNALSHRFVMFSTICSLLLVILLIPFFGWLSDKTNRLFLLALASSGLLVLSYPFMQAINYGNMAYFLSMQLLISIPCACYYSVATVSLTDLFPMPIRCTTLSLVYSVSASLASGIPPLLSDFLVRTTHWVSSPALIICTLASVVLINLALLIKKQVSLAGQPLAPEGS
ncbi:MAG: hypothetical protein CK426_07500 [Legionella sp.]|nr:MAG: hypothetical protein CK423_03975 [Legionella sp.]PJD97723.1 MAG: hypothetical protein CK426_07500 [Legionella sp.]